MSTNKYVLFMVRFNYQLPSSIPEIEIRVLPLDSRRGICLKKKSSFSIYHNSVSYIYQISDLGLIPLSPLSFAIHVNIPAFIYSIYTFFYVIYHFMLDNPFKAKCQYFFFFSFSISSQSTLFPLSAYFLRSR